MILVCGSVEATTCDTGCLALALGV